MATSTAWLALRAASLVRFRTMACYKLVLAPARSLLATRTSALALSTAQRVLPLAWCSLLTLALGTALLVQLRTMAQHKLVPEPTHSSLAQHMFVLA